MIDFGRLGRNLEEFRLQYKNGAPFEVLVIDDFLTSDGSKSLEVGQLMEKPTSQQLTSDSLLAKN